MAGKPGTIMGWAKKLFVMRGGKFAVRVIGWKTPSTRPGHPFGMTLPRERITSIQQIPKSAIWVKVVMVQKKDGRPSKPIQITVERLLSEFYIV